MNKLVIRNVLLSIVVGIILLFPITAVHALSSTQGAEISDPETNSEWGHVLYFPNSETSKINRYSLNLARNFFSFDPKAAWTTIIPQEQAGAQEIAADSFIMNLKYNKTMATIQDFSDHGISFHFFTTQNGTDFTDVTNSLIAKDGAYQVPGKFVGYRIEMVKIDPKASIPDTYEVSSNCTVNVNLQTLTQEQLTGQAGLDSWLDSQFPNDPPTNNRQNIFVIRPAIDGQVNYQKLLSTTDSPSWEKSTAIKGIPVDLIEHTETGEKVVASTLTDSEGKFLFSSNDGKDFTVSDTKNKLSIRVNSKNYSGWIVQNNTPAATEDLSVDVGRLTDIAQKSGKYTLAESKTNWNTPFNEVQEAGKNATNNQFILTDLFTEPSTTEPSTTSTSTTGSSTTTGTTTTSTSTTGSSTTTGTTTTSTSTTGSSTTGTSTTTTSTTTTSTTEPKKGVLPAGSNNSNNNSQVISSSKNKQLPMTGEKQSILSIAFGLAVLLLAISLLLATKNKKVS
ncbi:LPXTG cell wall anchor domain-containing protein [Enterococcus hulanensis]|uniref:LPXTG cell wall anchor domain-containing protein n=1 Tax=Enterococcus hulanensis TaxID=2559929 RepID=UPI0010F44AC3|nr:LPXTG cell wall anchor domain-containing protein [Enterococcus hulanensis]